MYAEFEERHTSQRHGRVPAIHVLVHTRKTWMPGTRPAMTKSAASGNAKMAAVYIASRRRLLARLVDGGVLAMRHRRSAVGDDQRVELDEAVALLVVIAGDFCARGQFIAAASGVEKLH